MLAYDHEIRKFMSHYHAVVWLDHAEAHVMHVSTDDVEKSIVKPTNPHQHLHVRSGTLGSGRLAEDISYYHAITDALMGAKEILIVGPASAKLQLIKHIHAHHPAMVECIVGIETVDHPTDAQLVAYARKYFKAKDRILT
jgi:stalled ribosome rescue protein Dom34